MEQKYKELMQETSLYQTVALAVEYLWLSNLMLDPAMENLFRNMTKENRGAMALAYAMLVP